MEVKSAPGVIQSNTEPTSPHSNNSDSGTVALIAIAILTTILVIASVVSKRNFIISMNSFYWRHELLPLLNLNTAVCAAILCLIIVVHIIFNFMRRKNCEISVWRFSADFKSCHFLYSLFN